MQFHLSDEKPNIDFTAYTNQAATSLAENKDKVIFEVLDEKLGEGAYTLESLRGRLHLIKYAGVDEPETLYLDGEPLVTFSPPELHQEHTETGVKYHFTQQVQRHGGEQ